MAISKYRKKILRTDKYWIHTETQKLLDVLCGNTAFIFGYNNQYILEKMINLQSKISFLNDSNFETCEELELLIEKLLKISKMDGLGWAVSGSDGVECSIYANDQYWFNKRNDKFLILCFYPCYHGATYLERIFRKEYAHDHKIVSIDLPSWQSITDRELYEKKTLETIIQHLNCNNKIGAILIESCPWIAGLRPWSKYWWQSLRRICDQYDINFIVDDTLGGVGKQGFYFSHLKYDIVPDIVSTGKSFTAGYSPLSVSCFTKKIYDVIKDSYDYSHTWNPNLAGVGAALAVLEKFNETDVIAIEKRSIDLLTKMKNKMLIKDFIVQGLMIQIELPKQINKKSLLINGLNTTVKKDNTIFFCLPIIADDEYFFEFETRLNKAIK